MVKRTTVNTQPRCILLGSGKGLGKRPLPPRVLVCHDRTEVEAEIRRPGNNALWITFSRNATDILLSKALALRARPSGSQLLTLTPPRSESIPALQGLFHPVHGLVEGFQWLVDEELIEAVARNDALDRLIGGSVDLKAKTLTLVRGNLEAVIVPFASFQQSGDGTKADFTRFSVTDYGRTVALGEYEASADAILYEFDPDYRRRLNKQRRQDERSFGASLMRLRKQKRLKRSDFLPLSSKEIARIERNEVDKPRAKTLDVIAGRLGVRKEDIESY